MFYKGRNLLAINPADLFLHLNKGICVKGEDWASHLIKCSSDYLLASAGWGWLCLSTDITLRKPGPHLPGDHQQRTKLPVLGGTLCYCVRGAWSVPCHAGTWPGGAGGNQSRCQGLSVVSGIRPALCWPISFWAMDIPTIAFGGNGLATNMGGAFLLRNVKWWGIL